MKFLLPVTVYRSVSAEYVSLLTYVYLILHFSALTSTHKLYICALTFLVYTHSVR